MNDCRSHRIAPVRIFLDLLEQPDPPGFGPELKTELVQLVSVDEQVGILRRRLRSAGALKSEQDAETAKGRS
jgi:hypothetical protein